MNRVGVYRISHEVAGRIELVGRGASGRLGLLMSIVSTMGRGHGREDSLLVGRTSVYLSAGSHRTMEGLMYD